jgi:predicted ATPase
MSDLSDEETDDPRYADRRNFYKVEKWSRDGLRVELMLYMRIPATLHDSLMARLDRLIPMKEVAQIGAAIGREFSYELLSTASASS